MKNKFKKIIKKAASIFLIFSLVISWTYGLIPGTEKLSPEVKVAEAANLTWTGAAGDNKYSTAGNWSTAKVPSLADNITLNGTSCSGSNCNMTLDVSTTTTSLTLVAGYTGTVTQAAGKTLTISGGNFTIASGTFVGGDSAINVDNGAFTLSDGTFTPSSGANTFERSFTFSGGTFNGSGKTITFDGGTSDSTTFTCTGDFNTTTGINSVSIAGVAGNGGFTLASGCTLAANVTQPTNGGDVTVNSGASLTATNNWASRNVTNNGTITVTGTSWSSIAFTNSGTTTLASATTFDLNGNFTNNAGGVISYGGTNITLTDDWTQNGTFSLTGKNLTFDGGSSQHTTFNCTGDFNANTGIGSVNIAGIAGNGGFVLASGCTLAANVNQSQNGGSVTINSGAFFTSTSTSWVSGSVTNNGTVTVTGTGWNTTGLTNSGTTTTNSVTSFVVGALTNSTTLSLPSATTFDINGNFTNNAGGVISYGGTNITLTDDWTQNGTFSLTGKNLTFDGGSSQHTTFNCTGDFNATTGINSVTIAGIAGNGGFILASGCTLAANVTQPTNGGDVTVNSGASLTATNNWTSRTVTNNGTIIVSGTTWNSAGLFTNNGTTTANSLTSFTSLGFTNSGTTTMSSATTFDINDANLLNNAGATIIYGGTNINVERNWTNTGTFDLTGKNVIFDGALSDNTTFTCTGNTFAGSITINKTSTNTFVPVNDCTIAGSFTRTDGILSNPAAPTTLTIQGNLSVSTTDALFGANLTGITLSGSNDQTLSYSGPALTIPITINKAGGKVSLGANFTTSSNLTFTAGTFDSSTYTSTFPNLITLPTGTTYIASTTTQTLNGGLTVTGGTFTGGAGTVDINGNLTFSSGTINPGAGNLTLSGNLSNTGGTFSASSGTVTLDGGSQTILGSNTFYNFTKSTSTTDTLTFASSTTQTILGTLTLQGAASNLLSLRSDADGTQWNIDPQGTRTIAYLDVKDSNNTNALVIDAIGTNSTNSNNNTNWIFVNSTYTQSDYRFYENIDGLQPSTALGTQSVATTITSTSTPIRLRMNIAVGTNDLPINFQQFRLQVSTATTTGWVDIYTSLGGGGEGWWNSSWQDRKAITITNSTSTSATDIPVNLAITYEDSMDSNFGDLRFTNSTGTELDYWVESSTTSISASVWVELDSLPASASTDIYMYYNNPSAASASSGRDTFPVFEDMTQTPAGTLKNSASYDSTNKWVRLTQASGSQQGQLEYSYNPGDRYAAHFQFWAGGGNGADAAWLYAYNNSTPALEDSATGGYAYAYDENADQLQLKFNGSSLTTAAQTSMDNSTWHTADVYQIGNNVKMYYDGTLKINYTDSTRTLSGSLLGFAGRTGGLVNEHRVKNIYVRKYVGADPSISYGEEEPQGSDAWLFYNNASVASGTPISDNLLSTSNIKGVYMESNPTALNPYLVSSGQFVEYDFALDVSNLLANTDYYFRMVKDDGTALGTYTYYPTLTFVPATPPAVSHSGGGGGSTEIGSGGGTLQEGGNQSGGDGSTESGSGDGTLDEGGSQGGNPPESGQGDGGSSP